MKKALIIATLLISTALSAHYNRSSFFDDNFWDNFDHKFQEFNHQIAKLQHKYAQRMESRQYFDKNTNAYILEIKTQGIDKRNLDIETTSNKLTVKGKQAKNTDNAHSSNAFSFATNIPNDGDADNIVVSFKNGVLKVSIPKLKQAKPQVRKITIQ